MSVESPRGNCLVVTNTWTGTRIDRQGPRTLGWPSSEITSSPTFELSEWGTPQMDSPFFRTSGGVSQRTGDFSMKKIDSRAPNAEIKARHCGKAITRSVRTGQYFRSGRDETGDSHTFRSQSGDLRGSFSSQCAVRSHQRLGVRSVRPSDCASTHGWSGCRILTRIDREIDSCGPGGPPQWRGFDGVSSLSENWPSDRNGSTQHQTARRPSDLARGRAARGHRRKWRIYQPGRRGLRSGWNSCFQY